MLKNKYYLLKKNENKELFRIQKKILDSIKKNNDTNSIMQLSLLQTLSPHEDYENAVKILEYHGNLVDDIRIEILGAYFCSLWIFNRENIFLNKLNNKFDYYSSEIKSIIYYLNALHLYYREENKQAIVYLKKSIILCNNYLNNYYLLSVLLEGSEKVKYLNLAKANIKKIISIREIENYDITELIDPILYIEENIKGIIIDENNYDRMFR